MVNFFKGDIKKYGRVTLLFVTLGLLSCEHDIDPILEQESTSVGNRLLTISAMLPPEYTNSLSRLILEDDEGGIKTRWEKDDDELLLFLENGTKQYTEVAHIKSLSNDNRVADFEIKIPEDWVGKCNIYGMLQKSKLPESGMLSQQDVACCSTLEDGRVLFRTARNQRQFSAEFSSNPALWFKNENVDIATSNVEVHFQHLGYLIALHVKNTTSNVIDIPNVEMFTTDGEPWFLSDGFKNIGFEVKTGKCISVASSSFLDFSKKSKTVGNTHKEISSGDVVTLYHWLPYQLVEAPALDVRLNIKGVAYDCIGKLKKRPVTKGMVYHIYLEYDGHIELKLCNKF